MFLLTRLKFVGFFVLLIGGLVACEKPAEETVTPTPEPLGVSARIGNVDWKAGMAYAVEDTGYMVLTAYDDNGKKLTMTIAGVDKGKFIVNASTASRVAYVDSSYKGIKTYHSEVSDTLLGFIEITAVDRVKKTFSGKFSLFLEDADLKNILILENGLINQVPFVNLAMDDSTIVYHSSFQGEAMYSSLDSSTTETVNDTVAATKKAYPYYEVQYKISSTKTLKMLVKQTLPAGSDLTPSPEDESEVAFELIEDGKNYTLTNDGNNSFIITSRDATKKRIFGSLVLKFDGEEALGETLRLNGNFMIEYP